MIRYLLSPGSDYNFRLVQGTDFENGTLVAENEITGTSLSVTVNTEGTYTWGVRGQNQLTNSPYTTRTFSIDNTAPPRPAISSPTAGSIVFSPVTVTWGPNSTGALDTILLSADSTFSTIERSIASDSLKAQVESTAGVRYLKVKRADLAGNQSADSEVIQITVQ